MIESTLDFIELALAKAFVFGPIIVGVGIMLLWFLKLGRPESPKQFRHRLEAKVKRTKARVDARK